MTKSWVFVQALNKLIRCAFVFIALFGLRIFRVLQNSVFEQTSFDSAQATVGNPCGNYATRKSLKLMSEGRQGERSRTMKNNKNYNFAELY